MTEIFALVATSIFILVSIGVGIRLLAMGLRERDATSFLLGASLVMIVGVGYALLTAATLLESRGAVAAAGMVMATGWCGTLAFTLRVFRPNAIAAKGFVGLMGMVLLVSGGLQANEILTTDIPLTGATQSNYWSSILVAALVSYAWGGAESLLYWMQLRKRLVIGLADPVVTNRFLLFAVVMGMSFLNLVVPTVIGLRGGMTLTDGLKLWSALSGLVCAGSLYLAFFPPRAYLARLQAS